MTTTEKKFTCFVCGYKTLDTRCDWDICPICFWEDDILVQSDDDDRNSPANGMTVSQAQANFICMGAVDTKSIENVRKPNDDDELDSDWKPMKKAVELANDGKS